MRLILLQRLCPRHIRPAVTQVPFLTPKHPRWITPSVNSICFQHNRLKTYPGTSFQHNRLKTYPGTRSFCQFVELTTRSRPTIFALSSGHGKCGVGVIRISGPKASDVVLAMTGRSSLPEPRLATVGALYHPISREMLDRGLVLWFPGPASFTGEDVCELHVHGGPAVINAIHEALEGMPDVQYAEAGEFTKRAFLNGKLDLTEVEGMADLIHAETEAQRKQALRQMEGELGRMYADWRNRLLRTLAHVEAYIDFSEDENIEEGVLEQAQDEANVLLKEIQSHLADNRRGERLRNGVHVAILGKPNVGKSSLLNAICQRPAAIVSPLAGTTRDVVESAVNIGGYPVVLSDTAGLRKSEDVVEREGVRRARQRAREADIKVIMLNALHLQTTFSTMAHPNQHIQRLMEDFKLTSQSSTIYSDDESNGDDEKTQPKNEFPDAETIIVLNKLDLVEEHRESLEKMCQQGIREVNGTGSMPCCVLSSKTGIGLERFLEVLRDKVKDMCGNPLTGNPSLTQARHRRYLNRCLNSLYDFEKQDDIVKAAEHLRIALRHLGKMTGRVGAEEILDVVFGDFCIGK
ncbi:tRNA modification GTPase GTPBP3, mitochondrial-like [Amphiura filiformis]|uniref:tRNA modification GTPase GTPBP3, mitochondrial-like n=1 Tax=Amphiura filiformis TaxID=82378 RepID=UPI003B2202D9